MKRINIQISFIVLFIFVTFFETTAFTKKKKPFVPTEKTYSSIREAVKFANGLEKTMKDNSSSFKTKKEIIAHFQEGFSAKISENLGTYHWNKEKNGVDENAKSVLKVPQEVHVLEVSRHRAVAYFNTDKDLIRDWKHKKLTITRLGLINKHWIIYQVATVDQLPEKYLAAE